MYLENISVCNPSGLHARPASDFTRCAGKYESRIFVKRATDEGRGINAKSIVLLLSQGFGQGEEITIMADGVDEEAGVKALVELVRCGFGEI